MPVKDFNDNIILHAGKMLDWKAGPHLTISEALARVPVHMRVQGLTISIRQNGNPTDPIVEYWWRDGIRDFELIPKVLDSVPPYRADVLVSDWIGSGQSWELIIHPNVHKQENVKQLVVFFFDQNNINRLVPYRVDGIGTVTIFSNRNISGHVIISDLHKGASGVGTNGGTGTPGSDVGLMYSVIHQEFFSVTHNLGKVPSVEIRDQEGRIVQARVEFPDLNNTTIRFSRFFTGTIHLN